MDTMKTCENCKHSEDTHQGTEWIRCSLNSTPNTDEYCLKTHTCDYWESW